MVEQKKEQSPKTTSLSDLEKLQKSLASGRTVIGVDVGVSSVNIAQTALYKGKPTIIKVVVENIPPVQERERDAVTITTVKKALSGFNTQKADIICVMPSQQTLIENMILPIMPEDEIRDAVRIEVTSSESFSIQDPILDHQVVGKIIDKGVEKMNVVVAAAARLSVDKLLTNFIAQKAKPLSGGQKAVKVESLAIGVDVAALIPVSIAIENIIKTSKLKTEETIAIIEIGTLATELSIYRDSQLEFSRKIPVSGMDLTRSLTSALFTTAGKLELTLEEAEEIKREFGIPAPGENFMIKGKIMAGQVLALLRPRLEQLAGEISRSFDFYQEKNRSAKVDRLVIFGGGAKMKGLPEFLSAELGLSVVVGNPLEDLELLSEAVLANKDDAQRLVLAIGASLGDPKGLSLMPEHLKDRKKKSFERMAVWTVLGLFVAGLGLVCFACFAQMTMAEQRAAAAVSAYEDLKPKLEEFKNSLRLKRMIRTRPDLGIVLKQLSFVPSSMYFTKMDFNRGKVRLFGYVVGQGRDVQEAPAQLVLDLQKGAMSKAKLVSSKAVEKVKNITEFEIEGQVSLAGGK